jgi:hypothetical protein
MVSSSKISLLILLAMTMYRVDGFRHDVQITQKSLAMDKDLTAWSPSQDHTLHDMSEPEDMSQPEKPPQPDAKPEDKPTGHRPRYAPIPAGWPPGYVPIPPGATPLRTQEPDDKSKEGEAKPGGESGGDQRPDEEVAAPKGYVRHAWKSTKNLVKDMFTPAHLAAEKDEESVDTPMGSSSSSAQDQTAAKEPDAMNQGILTPKDKPPVPKKSEAKPEDGQNSGHREGIISAVLVLAIMAMQAAS